jgi:hypothetical protein
MLQAAFPFCLEDDINKVARLLSRETHDARIYTVNYHMNGVEICFPYRIYFTSNPESIVGSLSDQQKMILYCIYSRHHNGFVREKCIRLLLSMNYDEWTIPFIVKICDEYVIQILEIVYTRLQEQDTEHIKNFCLENHEESLKSYDRMVSYWNEYYRGYECRPISHYIGYKLFHDCFGIALGLLNVVSNKRKSQLILISIGTSDNKN